MNPSERALWFIECHFGSEISLDDVAAAAGVSRYHASRAFEAATGRPIMRYVRGRRLSVAAHALCDGAPDILAVALEAGYGSHEAFTRAFRDQFGVTPESVRTHGRIDHLRLVEPIKLKQDILETLEPPRIENGKPLLIAGLGERYTCDTCAGIPAQWQRFLPHFCQVQGQVGKVAYGLTYNFDDAGNFDYVAGVEVSDFSGLPPDWTRVRVPAQRYAVFMHRGHISTIRSTWNTVWNRWFPQSQYESADAPNFERYDESFDSTTGQGGVELWIPIKA